MSVYYKFILWKSREKNNIRKVQKSEERKVKNFGKVCFMKNVHNYTIKKKILEFQIRNLDPRAMYFPVFKNLNPYIKWIIYSETVF